MVSRHEAKHGGAVFPATEDGNMWFYERLVPALPSKAAGEAACWAPRCAVPPHHGRRLGRPACARLFADMAFLCIIFP